MTEKQKEQWAGAAVLVVLVLLIAWALWGAFGNAARAVMPGASVNVGGNTGGGVNIDTGDSNPYALPSGGGCCGGCGGSSGCPVSPSAIQTVNQMLQTGTTAANQIYAAGNATLAAMADIMNQEDPLYAITTG